MEKIYSKVKPEMLLHVINKKEDIMEKRTDLSPEEEFLQVACFSLSKGKGVKAHKHLDCKKIVTQNQESWLVVEGSIKVALYDVDDKILKEDFLRQGDCLITFRG